MLSLVKLNYDFTMFVAATLVAECLGRQLKQPLQFINNIELSSESNNLLIFQSTKYQYLLFLVSAKPPYNRAA